MRGAGTFERASRALDLVREAKVRIGVDHPAVTVWQCTSRLNCDALGEMYRFARARGAGFAMFFMVDGPMPDVGDALWDAPRGVRRLVDPDDICLTLQERRRVTLDYFRMLAAVEDRGVIAAARTRLSGHARVWYNRLGPVVYRDCSRSMHHIVVDPWGNLVPCEHLYTHSYGNCRTDGASAYLSDKHAQLRRAIRSGTLPACRECNAFGQYRSRHDFVSAPSRVTVGGR
jgi:radical SAM protein with 4Fe4S-binding SPASM domain